MNGNIDKDRFRRERLLRAQGVPREDVCQSRLRPEHLLHLRAARRFDRSCEPESVSRLRSTLQFRARSRLLADPNRGWDLVPNLERAQLHLRDSTADCHRSSLACTQGIVSYGADMALTSNACCFNYL